MGNRNWAPVRILIRMRRKRRQNASHFSGAVKKNVTLLSYPTIRAMLLKFRESCSGGVLIGGPGAEPGRVCRGKELRFAGLTTNLRAGIVPRLEHGAFLVLTCGGALLVETGRGINVIVA